LDDWILRDEIYAAAHRWPLIVLFILAGSLLGWGVAYLLPSPYQASEEISVELNAYRAVEDRYAAGYAETEFRTLDDYKHWQMSQLDVLVRSEPYLQETLTRLQQADPAWNPVGTPELRNMLKANWRNAGRWRLIAVNQDSDRAGQAVRVWKEVILEKTKAAVESSQDLFQTELRLRALAGELHPIRERLASLPGVRAALAEWRSVSDQLPADRPLGEVERWQVQALAARAAGLDEAWQELLAEYPSAEAPLSDYQEWVDRLLVAVEAESDFLAGREQSLAAEQAELLAEWESAIPAGQGLSATLLVDPVSSEAPLVRPLRPTSQAVLVGGLLGLVAWFLLVLYQITRRAYR
jgi:hypothetical protein